MKPQELVAASAASKMVASTATYPHEVLRSHMHIEGTGPIKGLATTCERVRAFSKAGSRSVHWQHVSLSVGAV